MAVQQIQHTKAGQTRLLSLGFSYNPFERLEASNDPFLPDYLIGHDMFAVAWEPSPAALFAPAGGGKTAMRIYTLRACWLSNSKKRKFPISYDVPFFANLSALTTLEAHRSALNAAIATDLILAFSYRPDLYLSLPTDRRIFLLSLIQQSMPSDLVYNLGFLEEVADPIELSSRLDRTYILSDPPPKTDVAILCQIMQEDLHHITGDPISPLRIFEHYLTFILNDLSFESIFLLVDGVDGDGAKAMSLAEQFAVLYPLLEQALSWEKEHLYLKFFLPLELEPIILAQSTEFYQGVLRAVIAWDTPKLAEILRRRVYMASQGSFGSLDAISSPAIRDVETLIAQRARPLPRETIVMAGLVLENYLARRGRYLEPEDIEQAKKQYGKRSIFPDNANQF